MPGGDGTGPAGMGPMTGRAAGFCSGYSGPGYMNIGMRRGLGMSWGRTAGRGRWFGRGIGRGMGFGWGRWATPSYGNVPYQGPPARHYGPAPTRERELEMLKAQSEDLQGALSDIQKRISDLESGSEAKK